MRKTIILIAIAVTLGIQNSAMGVIVGGVLDPSKTLDLWSFFFGTSTAKTPTKGSKIPPQNNTPLPQKNKEIKEPLNITSFLDTLNAQLNTTKEQIKETEKIYQSITGPRQEDIVPRISLTTGYFRNPESIYGKSGFTKDSFLENNIGSSKAVEENIVINQYLSRLSVHEARQFIEKRSQYAAIVDKAVSLQVFRETESRFRKIKGAFSVIPTQLDLKGILELQSYMEGTLSIFKNEATKLQMVAHLRNAEQTLIRQQKYKRNIRILNHKNKGMPQVRYASATQ
ncbi:type IV secretion system protein [Bartonella sp. AU18XJBT]|uniref:type IV secretion system protein n=1 Tax=Bartonella sp. AU18XJBT TaxID=3019089 RepID=UPI002360D4F2|nr:type IV secretion system protein [Bartonella sp. AU18XJBT]